MDFKFFCHAAIISSQSEPSLGPSYLIFFGSLGLCNSNDLLRLIPYSDNKTNSFTNKIILTATIKYNKKRSKI